MKIMTIKSNRTGNVYECYPEPVRLDAWGTYYRGRCLNCLETQWVSILEFGDTYLLPDYFLKHLEYIFDSYLNHYQLPYPNLASIIDFFAIDLGFSGNRHNGERWYLIEEEFVPLSDYIEEAQYYSNKRDIETLKEVYSSYKGNKIELAKTIINEVLKELDYMHSCGQIVRYLNPGNIIFLHNGKIKIRGVDRFFAFAWHTFKGTKPVLSFDDFFPAYCSPEVIMDRNRVDGRADIFSLGMVLFYLIEGHQPFGDEGTHYIKYQQINGYLPLTGIKDKRMKSIIRKATQKDPNMRFQSVREFIEALEGKDAAPSPWHKNIFSFLSRIKF